MSHFRRKRPRREPTCGMCQWYRQLGNGSIHHRHFRSIEARDPLLYEDRVGKHKVRPQKPDQQETVDW